MVVEAIEAGEGGRGRGPCGNIGHIFRECGASNDPCKRGGGYRGGRGPCFIFMSHEHIVRECDTQDNYQSGRGVGEGGRGSGGRWRGGERGPCVNYGISGHIAREFDPSIIRGRGLGGPSFW